MAFLGEGNLIAAPIRIHYRLTQPSGLLRISLPTPYAHYRVLPILPAFRAQYPDVEIDVHISNLRRKLGADDGVSVIRTVRSSGYLLTRTG